MGPAPTATMFAVTTLSPANIANQLTASIPYLEPNGSNWAIFSLYFKEAMQATRHWGHFDGSIKHPVPASSTTPIKDEEDTMEK
jgi:hypothetical protein